MSSGYADCVNISHGLREQILYIMYNTLCQSKNQGPQYCYSSIFLHFYPFLSITYSTYKYWIFGKNMIYHLGDSKEIINQKWPIKFNVASQNAGIVQN